MDNEKRYVADYKVEFAEWNRKWKVSDTRRKIFCVVFNDGTTWYPRDEEIKIISILRDECFKHNIQFPNIDPMADEKPECPFKDI